LTRLFEPDAPVVAEEYLASLPSVLRVPDALEKIRERVAGSGRRLIVLDEDPTGTRTVHDVPVLTAWSYSELRRVLEQPNSVVYVVTSSRGLDEAEAVALNTQIGRRLRRAAADCGKDFVLISGSDSTLRGHYPAETDALERELGADFDGVILCPCFFEAGHMTVSDVQWVRRNEELLPASHTEFASDPAFGYSSSNLANWVEEKTGGRFSAEGVLRIGLSDIREGGPEGVAGLLRGARGAQPVVVNAAEYADLEVFVLGLLEAEAAGKSFLYRTGPSFVRVRGGIPEKGPLEACDLYRETFREGHGLVIVGSHAEQTTRQLREAEDLDGLRTVELSVPRLLDAQERAEEIDRALDRVNGMLPRADVLVYTSREVVGEYGNLSDSEAGSAISAVLVEVMRGVDWRIPLSFVIAVGGTTASDVVTKGLNVRRAEVAGQVLPGIAPAWILPADSDYPGLPCVVFTDDLGGPDALAKVIEKLREGSAPAGEAEASRNPPVYEGPEATADSREGGP
jgi:uncharacterized protein YgbK (DUF1537 family)